MRRGRAWTLVCVVTLSTACGGADAPRAPGTPTHLAASPGDGVVGLRWDAVAGADAYTVYWSTASGVTRASGTAIRAQGTSVSQDGLTNGVTYYYVVTAVNGAGESAESVEVDATPLPSHYPLTISHAGSGGGTVVSVPVGIDCGPTCAASFDTGAVVSLTASPDDTSTFAGWSGDCSGIGDCAVTMDGSRTVTATFVRNTYALTVARAGTGGGTVTSTPEGITCGATCSATYDASTVVSLSAAADATSTFTGWTGACTGTGACSVTVDGAKSVTATFARNSYALTVTRAGTGGGTVTSTPVGITCGATCSTTYDAGTVVSLSAAADSSSTFTGWGGACTGTGACTVTMDGTKSVTATFTKNTYALTVTMAGSGGGTVTSAPAGIDCGATCSATYPAGTEVTLSARGDGLSSFTGWTGACSGTNWTCTVTMDVAKSVTANFVRNRYTLSIARAVPGGADGSVTSTPAGIDCGLTCAVEFDAGTVVTLTVVPDATSIFTGWSGACNGASTTCTLTMSQARMVTASFIKNTYALTVSKTGGGTVTSAPVGINCGSTCSAMFDAGSTVSLVATADPTSSFVGWGGGSCSGTAGCVVTMGGTRTVSATFVQNTYLLTVTRDGSGAGTVGSNPAGISCGVTCAATYDASTAVVLTAIPDATSTFAGWTGGGCTGTSPCTVNMTAAKSVRATFTRQSYLLSVTVAGAGTGRVTSSPAGVDCTGGTCQASYQALTVLTLTATPDSGSTFAGWSGDCTGASCTVSMTQARSVTATFTSP